MLSTLVLASVLTATAAPMAKVPGNTGKNDQVETKTCSEGKDLVLDGRGSVWNIKGKCGTVTVKGQGNAVTIEAVAKVVAKGQGHAITYSNNLSGKPELPTELGECTGCVVKKG